MKLESIRPTCRLPPKSTHKYLRVATHLTCKLSMIINIPYILLHVGNILKPCMLWPCCLHCYIPLTQHLAIIPEEVGHAQFNTLCQ